LVFGYWKRPKSRSSQTGRSAFASGAGSRGVLDFLRLDAIAFPHDKLSTDSTGCFGSGGSDASSFPTPEASQATRSIPVVGYWLMAKTKNQKPKTKNRSEGEATRAERP